MSHHIDIVFDGPPGPESCRFLEVEDEFQRSISVGQWLKRDDGYWVLRISRTGLSIAPDPRTEAFGELLHALQMVRDANLDDPHIPPIALATINAAIAKAEGVL